MNRYLVRPAAAASLPAALLLVLGTALPASAAVTVNSGGSAYGDGANDYMAIDCPGGVFTVSGSSAGETCASLTSVTLDGGGGTDTLMMTGLTPAAFPALQSVRATTDDAAADTINGSTFGEVLSGDSLDTINGGGGDDMIEGANSASGGDGDDTFMEISSLASGGAGDDRFIQFTSTGGIDGGPGTDSWEVDFDQVALGVGNTLAAFVVNGSGLTLDVENDGMPSQSVAGSGLEQMYVTLLRQGTQSYDGSGFPGSQHIRGVSGPDTIIGGADNDNLYGGTGNDVVTGGGGVDILSGGDGNDTINARDGLADVITCGEGVDTVVADAVDSVVGCEVVQLPAVVTPPPPAPVIPVTSAITGKKSYDKPAVAKFGFSSTTAGATFQCKLDKGKWKACSSKHKVKTAKLKVGKHKLQVRAVLGGQVDATPSVKRFKVTS
jgi:hypothetical protein